MKALISLFFAMCLLAFASQAQTKPNKVDRSINKANNSVNSASNSVNHASVTATNAVGTAKNAATQTKTVVDQLGDMVGAKKLPVGTIVIKVPGASRKTIKDLCEMVKTCQGVKADNVDYNFDDKDQSITIANYKGKIFDFLDELEKKNPQITDSNAKASKTDGVITITNLL
jgi:PDZ domain-containing secreted protein